MRAHRSCRSSGKFPRSYFSQVKRGQAHCLVGMLGELEEINHAKRLEPGSAGDTFTVINYNPIFQLGKLRFRKDHASSPKVDTESAAEPGYKIPSSVSAHQEGGWKNKVKERDKGYKK